MTATVPVATHDGHGHVASLVSHRRTADLDRAQAAVRELVEALGLDPTADGLVETPAGVARRVEAVARRPQVQERLTAPVADWLETHLAPRGVGVVVEAEHLCMSIRGSAPPVPAPSPPACTACCATTRQRGVEVVMVDPLELPLVAPDRLRDPDVPLAELGATDPASASCRTQPRSKATQQ